MLDVHPPHEAAHGIRDFMIHLVTITIGLLIALAVIALGLMTATLNRLRDFAVLKALGGRTPRLARAVAMQVLLTVVLASKGYPGAYEKNTTIASVPVDGKTTKVFHAGTALKDGTLVATGGRVLNATAVASSVAAAQADAYALVDQIKWDNGFCRRDIGWRAVAREKA